MADILILGGTRNLGYFTALSFLDAGHRVTIANRGVTHDALPLEVERLRADRSDTASVVSAIGTRSFDLVLDTTTYTGADARQAVSVFTGRCARYVFISSGQVYLVRENLSRPFREEDYDGSVVAEPVAPSINHDGWIYGVEKRDAEDVFAGAWNESAFPVTTLRLPMVASEYDHRGRIQAYIARVLDGGPLLIPEGAGLPLRHVYVRDVSRLVAGLADSDARIGRAYNISWGSSMTLDRFIELLAALTGRDPSVRCVPRDVLEASGLLTNCSPFSGKWMSELDNRRSLHELGCAGLAYTPPEVYLAALINDYETRWRAEGMVPAGYDRRNAEIRILEEGARVLHQGM